MTRIAPSWIVAIALTGILHLTTAQSPAFVPTNKVAAALGGQANFTCKSSGIPMSNCLWERDPRPGTQASATQASTLINFSPANAKPGEAPSDKPGYLFMGDGLEKGECGLAIQNVKEQDDGNWKCTLITNSGLYRGVVELEILRKPGPPKFNPSTLNNLKDDDRSPQDNKIICFAANGHPAPKFQWFIDNTPLTENLGPIDTRNEQGTRYTFQELVNYRFSWKDNGKKLRCVLQHEALTAEDTKEATLDIDVEYPPRSSREDGSNHVSIRAEIGTEKILSVNISANPKPDQVTWSVDGKLIRENDEKYGNQQLLDFGSGVYQANLKIRSVGEEDINKSFKLTLANSAGQANFDLKIQSDAAGSGGLSAGGIVLLILGIAALLIIIALVVVYARAQGLLCFKGDDGTASEKERMDGGSTAGTTDDQQQQKPGLKLTSRLTALYDNLLNKKKDKPVVADEENAVAAKETKEPVQESSTPVKPPGTPANPPPSDDVEKKPEDIVYAELDLARSGLATGGSGPQPEIVVRADDKTEYAEIVGVVGKVEEAKKSPSASAKSGGSDK